MFAGGRAGRLLLPLLVGLTLACTNPTSTGPGPGRGPTPTLPPSLTQSPAPYAIGLLASVSGPYAARGIATRNAVQLAADELNANGGIGGRTVNVLVEDDQSDPAQAVVGLKHLINEQVVAAVGPDTSVVAAALMPVEDQATLPMISLVDADAPSGSVHKFVFVVAPPPSLVAGSLLSYLQKSNLHNLAVLRETSSYGSAGIGQLRQQGPHFGVEVISDETYQLNDTDLTRQLTNVKNNPAVGALLVWGSAGPAAAIATRQARQLGVTVPLLLTVAQADPAFVQDAGDAASGAILEANRPLIASYLLPDDPAYQPVVHFVAAYQQATGKPPDQFAALGYDAFNLLAQAIAAAGVEPDPLVSQMEGTSFNGVAGPYAFSASTHAGMQPSALAMVTIRGGAFVPIKPNCDGCAQTTMTKE